MNRRVTTQDISWFLDCYRNGQLDLNPSYQRRSVWTLKDKRSFIDTIFRGYPCPAIFLHKDINDEGKQLYHVVDGKQRLETVIGFVNNKISVDKNFGDIMLDGKKWGDLESSPDLKKNFWDYIFSVEFVDTIEGPIINDVFDRLNRNARKLERQEIRHAKFDGWFITLAEAEAEKEEWSKLKVVTTARSRRMKDIQFISELLIIILKNRTDGFDQDFIDNIYGEYDSIEDLSSFSEESFSGTLNLVKNYALLIEEHNSCVTEYAKGFGNFYSLWALISLNKENLPEPDVFANKYFEFMSKVDEFDKDKNPEKFFEEHITDPSYKEPYKYFMATKGASTEDPQRMDRHESLMNHIIF
ncbi:DUF262 domain-containing protein [Thermodesulfobacteriota bacterium]